MTIETIAIDRCRPTGDQELREDVDRLVDEQHDGEDRHHGVALWNPPPIQAWMSRSGMSSSGSASSSISAVPARSPDQQQPPLPLVAPAPSSSANAGNINDVTAVPIPNTSAKSFAGTE